MDIELVKARTNTYDKSYTKDFISANLMTRYCKLIGQKYSDHICSKCEGEDNYVPEVQLE